MLRHLVKYTQHVLNERLYLNALVVPHLNPYVEVGYGIGTNIFDFGVFGSFANWMCVYQLAGAFSFFSFFGCESYFLLLLVQKFQSLVQRQFV